MNFVSLAGLIISFMSLFVAYSAMAQQNRDEMKLRLNRLFGLARTAFSHVMRFLVTAIPLGVVLISMYGISRFYISQAPITRSEIILLVFHFINFFVYLSVLGMIIRLWVERFKIKRSKRKSRELVDI